MAKLRVIRAICVSLIALIWATPSSAQANFSTIPSSSCDALLTADFSGIPDAPSQLISTELVKAGAGAPAYCRVEGYVAPQVGFELRMPVSNWNGKFFEVGCGGFCGSTRTIWCAEPLQRGYACISSDFGHKGPGMDELWAFNNLQALVDWGFRSAHVTALAGKAITERFYQKAPSKSYFFGCSSGGTQALSEAQRFPWDFDGIIAGAPAPNFSGIVLEYAWAGEALVDKAGQLVVTHADLERVHGAALAKCDLDDGVKDGVISNPLQCKFDPAELACKSGKKAWCLTPAQLQAVKKVYAGPLNSAGEKTYTGGPLPGSELNWVDGGASNPYAYSSSTLSNVNAADTYFRYLGFMPPPGPAWKLNDLNFDRDYKRFGSVESIIGASNPDLRKFKAAGGKLILYQGWQDHSDIPEDSVDYYETAEKTMGGRAATQAFFRLFTIPGMDHCSGGPGAFAIDYLSYLEAWVERAQAPDKMVGAHVPDLDWGGAMNLTFPLSPGTRVAFTRPVYPYPVRAKYKGTGDPNSDASFEPVEPGPQ